MCETTERNIQNVFDDERNNHDRIEELENDIKYMQKELNQCKKKAKILEREEDKLRIDLLKQKKIEWVECGLDKWREYIETVNDEVPYHIYYYDGRVYQQGYYKGTNKLNKKEMDHFNKYFNDYFYYGYPNYQDENDPNHDGSDCYMAFGGGGAYVKTLDWD